jgi:hypothetical protein
MTSYSLWTYLHILLFVFWLGADVGVFAAAASAKNSKLSFESRATLLKLAGFVDLFPRISFALMVPVGLHLAGVTGTLAVSIPMLMGAWAIGLLWAAAILVAYHRENTALAAMLNKLQTGFLGIAGLLLITLGGLSWLNGSPLEQGWFAAKILLFGAVFWNAIAIDYCFRPLVAPFMAIGVEGSTPAHEAAVTHAINRTLVAVSTLYVLIGSIAFLGVTKPF